MTEDRTEPTDTAGRVRAKRPSDAGARKIVSRRDAIGRVSKGVVAAGVAAWVTPEILVATPTAAGALSRPPGSGGGGGGGNPGGSPSGAGGGATPSPVTSPATGTSGGGSTGAVGTPATAAAGSGGSLPFTGMDALRDAELGAGIVAAGWALKRWAKRGPRPAPAGGRDIFDADVDE